MKAACKLNFFHPGFSPSFPGYFVFYNCLSLFFCFVSIQGSFKNKIEKLRRWSTSQGGSFKHPCKMKTLSLRSNTEERDDEDLCNDKNERRNLRPMVASVFGQVGKKLCSQCQFCRLHLTFK